LRTYEDAVQDAELSAIDRQVLDLLDQMSLK